MVGEFVPAGSRSQIGKALRKYAVEGQRWRKWMVGAKRSASLEEISESEEDSALITRMCGHYTLEEPEVQAALETLYANLKGIGLDGDLYTLKRIKDSIDRYIYCFGLYGLSSKLREAL